MQTWWRNSSSNHIVWVYQSENTHIEETLNIPRTTSLHACGFYDPNLRKEKYCFSRVSSKRTECFPPFQLAAVTGGTDTCHRDNGGNRKRGDAKPPGSGVTHDRTSSALQAVQR